MEKGTDRVIDNKDLIPLFTDSLYGNIPHKKWNSTVLAKVYLFREIFVVTTISHDNLSFFKRILLRVI